MSVPLARPPLTVLFLVVDEADRLGPALDSVAFAEEVVVADTGSTDGTQALAASRGARVETIPWEGWVASRNRSLALASNDWVLVLDADERVSPELAREIESVLSDPAAEGTPGFELSRRSTFLGREVRHGAWYPDRKLRLGRRSARFRVEGGRVHESFAVDGSVGRLEGPLIHHPYRDLADALRKAIRYARLGAEDRFERGRRSGPGALLVRPPLEFLRSYVLKAGFLDGRAGVGVALLHALSYLLRAWFLHELAHPGPGAGPVEPHVS